MYEAINYQETGRLIVTDIQNFPEEVLRSINQLWLNHSDNQFGFSVQSRIYIDQLGAGNDFNETIWRQFGTEVGWRNQMDWLPYDQLQFTLQDNQEGHLPRLVIWNDNDEQYFKNLFHTLLWRVNHLNI